MLVEFSGMSERSHSGPCYQNPCFTNKAAIFIVWITRRMHHIEKGLKLVSCVSHLLSVSKDSLKDRSRLCLNNAYHFRHLFSSWAMLTTGCSNFTAYAYRKQTWDYCRCAAKYPFVTTFACDWLLSRRGLRYILQIHKLSDRVAWSAQFWLVSFKYNSNNKTARHGFQMPAVSHRK